MQRRVPESDSRLEARVPPESREAVEAACRELEAQDLKGQAFEDAFKAITKPYTSHALSRQHVQEWISKQGWEVVPLSKENHEFLESVQHGLDSALGSGESGEVTAFLRVFMLHCYSCIASLEVAGRLSVTQPSGSQCCVWLPA